MIAKLKLYDYFGKNVVTRISMVLFFAKLRKIKVDKVVVDFRSIEFISRSCADEYLKQKDRLEETKEIVEINKSQEIDSMFEAVMNPSKNEIERIKPRQVIYI